MGDWYLRPDPMNPGQQVWAYDRGAPAPDPTVTGMLPAVVEQPAKLPAVEPAQEDLSHLDQAAGEIVSTEKLGPLDEVLIQPPQEPEWHNPREVRDYMDWYRSIGAEPA